MNSFKRIVRKVKEKKLQVLEMHLEHSELPFNTYIYICVYIYTYILFSLLAPGIIYFLEEITVSMILDIPQSIGEFSNLSLLCTLQ